jgi:hypothetical protein
MPLISDLLRDLQQYALTHNNTEQLTELWRTLAVPKHTLTYTEDILDVTYAGDLVAVTNFIAWFKNLVQNQKLAGTRTADRVAALTYIETQLLPGLGPGAFVSVDPVKFAFQLALRVREPRLINQMNANLCGPNSIVIDLARDSALQYVKLAIDLFKTGSGTLKNLIVQPAEKLRNNYNAEALGECDYVVLGSVRNSNALLWGELIRNIGTLTKPGVLCGYLRDAGYNDVEDHTFFNVPFYVQPINLITSGSIHAPRPTGFVEPGNPAQKKANLQLMANKIALGHKAVMNAEGVGMAQKIAVGGTVTDSGLTGPSNAMATHWTLVTKLTLSATHVTEIKLYTWGGSFKKQNIPIDDFGSRYAGFVSYRI